MTWAASQKVQEGYFHRQFGGCASDLRCLASVRADDCERANLEDLAREWRRTCGSLTACCLYWAKIGVSAWWVKRPWIAVLQVRGIGRTPLLLGYQGERADDVVDAGAVGAVEADILIQVRAELLDFWRSSR